MIQTTRWSPDTCDCVLDYQWDDSVAQDARTHSVATVVKACSFHDGLDKNVHWTKVTDENTRKNYAIYRDIVANFPTLTTTDSSGNIVLKDGVLSWSFDVNRVLNITISSLTQNQKNTLQNLVNTKFGIGKILII